MKKSFVAMMLRYSMPAAGVSPKEDENATPLSTYPALEIESLATAITFESAKVPTDVLEVAERLALTRVSTPAIPLGGTTSRLHPVMTITSRSSTFSCIATCSSVNVEMPLYVTSNDITIGADGLVNPLTMAGRGALGV